ncbi:MAG: type II secretion system protein [Phycisphaerales bacterium]|nr:type II secretion system protein [Phycisphaerales bacterium]
MKRRAFTMLEMMTVLVVIAVLAGLLFPALQLTSTASTRTHCRANLRQLARAATQYAIGHGGRLPPGLLYGTDADALSGDVRSWDWWRRPDGTVQAGPLWALTDRGSEVAVLRCPTAPETPASWEGDPVTGYNYNVAFVAAEARPPTAGDAGLGAWELVVGKPNLEGLKELTLAQCRTAGTAALFGTGGRRGGVNKFMRSPVNAGSGYDTAYAGGQSFPGGGSNVGWIDGHVSTCRTPSRGIHWDALPTWLTDSLDWPNNGFLCDDASAYDPR